MLLPKGFPRAPRSSQKTPATCARIADLQQHFLTHGTASAVDLQLLNGNLQQYAMAHEVAGVAGAWHQAVIAIGNTIRAQATIMG
jgi:hypothetical protein